MTYYKRLSFLFWSLFCFSIFFLSIGYSTLNSTLLVESKGTVEGKTVKGNSMYSWQAFPLMDANIDTTIKTLKELNVTTIYHSFLESDFIDGTANRIASKLSLNGIKVYHMTGSPAWYTSKDYVVPEIDAVYNYNLSVNSSSELITGIIFDIEPYLVDEFLNDQIAGFIQYSDTMVDISQYMKSHNLKTGIAIPNWYDVYATDDVSFTKDENQRARLALENLIKNVDITSIMNYNKYGMVDNIADEVAIAKQFDANIESIIEFHRPAGNEVPENVTVWGEDNPLQYTQTQWNAMSKKYNYENLTFSYHYLECILERLDVYERVDIRLVDENNKTITSGNIVIRFNSGETIIRAIGESNVLPKEANFTMHYPGYYLTKYKETDLGDRKLRRTYKLTAFEKNTLEIYPRVPDSNGGYTDIQNGTIRIVDAIYGDYYDGQIKLGYAIFQNINANYPYEVYVTSSDGTEYELISAIADDDSNTAQTISNNNHQIIIPPGLKENHYVVPVIYLKAIAQEQKYYTIEVYPFLYNSKRDRYNALNKGTLKLTRGQEEISCSISNGYCNLYGVAANENYTLTVDNQSYEISYVTAYNDEGEKIILTNNDQFTVSKDFIEGNELTINVYLLEKSASLTEYTVENYAFKEYPDGSRTPINSGTLVFTETVTGKQIKCDIDEEGEYCFLNNVKENSTYKVALEGTNYILTSFVALDSTGNYQDILDIQGNIKIPIGFRKDGYVVTKSFFR